MSATAKKLVFDTTYKNQTRIDLKLSINEYLVALFIQEQMLNQESAIQGWCYASKEQIGEYLGLSRRTINTILTHLHAKGLIEKFEKTRFIRTTQKFYQYQIGIASAQTAQTVQNLHTLPKEKVAPKENILYTSPSEREGTQKKRPSCPLLNGSPLKAKYPNGHDECVEYLQDEEHHRGNKFINHAKQYMAIHKILKAGYGFDKMEKTRLLIEKKYGPHSWDYMTMANWLEKGSANA